MTGVFEHISLGFCWWDIPALAILLAVIVGFSVKRHKLRQKRKKLEEEMETQK